MRQTVRFALATIGSIVVATPLGSQPAVSDRADLLAAAREIRSAILRDDVDSILSHVSRMDGLGCTDTAYSYEQVRRDLDDRDSYLFMSLFDTARFAAKCASHYPLEYPATSDKDFFERVGDTPIDITFLEDNLARVTYRSTIAEYYPREYTLQKQEGRWKLVYAFIIGSCSCG